MQDNGIAGQKTTEIGSFNDGGNAIRRFFQIIETGSQLRGSQVRLVEERDGKHFDLITADRSEIIFNRHLLSIVGTIRNVNHNHGIKFSV